LPNADYHGPNQSPGMCGMRLRAHFQKAGPIRITREASVKAKSPLENLRPLPATKTYNKTRLATGFRFPGSKSGIQFIRKGACLFFLLLGALCDLAMMPLPPKFRYGPLKRPLCSISMRTAKERKYSPPRTPQRDLRRLKRSLNAAAGH
jgi:hypothetical protein